MIVDFNDRLASETEGKRLDRDVLARGVARRAGRPRPAPLLGRRVRRRIAATVVGQAAVTREWSDWRNGWLWWFQSVYVHPDYRGRGRLPRPPPSDPRRGPRRGRRRSACGSTSSTPTSAPSGPIESLGMSPGGYHVYEELWPERFGLTRSGRSVDRRARWLDRRASAHEQPRPPAPESIASAARATAGLQVAAHRRPRGRRRRWPGRCRGPGPGSPASRSRIRAALSAGPETRRSAARTRAEAEVRRRPGLRA